MHTLDIIHKHLKEHYENGIYYINFGQVKHILIKIAAARGLTSPEHGPVAVTSIYCNPRHHLLICRSYNIQGEETSEQTIDLKEPNSLAELIYLIEKQHK